MAEGFGLTCHELVSLDFRCGSTTDSEGCSQFRPLLGVKRTFCGVVLTSALPPTPDIPRATLDFRL